MSEEKVNLPFAGSEEFGFLDLLLALSENVKLIVIGSLLAGLCALGISFLLPQSYQSVAVLQTDQPVASLVVTAAVLDPVIADLGLAKDGSIEDARNKLREQIKAGVGRNDKLVTLTVSDPVALRAQSIANAVLQQAYKQSRPKGSVRIRLEVQLAEAQERFKNAKDASGGVLKRLELNDARPNASTELARGYAELLTATGIAQGQISVLQTQLEGVSEAQLIQAPTLPQKASQARKSAIVGGAMLAMALLLIIFIVARKSMLNAEKDALMTAKLARIRKQFSLK